MNMPCRGFIHRCNCRIKPCEVTEEASRQSVVNTDLWTGQAAPLS